MAKDQDHGKRSRLLQKIKIQDCAVTKYLIFNRGGGRSERCTSTYLPLGELSGVLALALSSSEESNRTMPAAPKYDRGRA